MAALGNRACDLASPVNPEKNNIKMTFCDVKVQVLYSLISQVWRTIIWLYIYPLVSGPVHSCAISAPRRVYSPAAISAHWTHHTHCHLCPTRYSFSTESSEHLRVKCLAQGHNIETMSQDWEGRNMIFLWKSCTKRGWKPHVRQRHRQSAML